LYGKAGRHGEAGLYGECRTKGNEMNRKKTGYFLLACAAITADQWLDSIGLLCGVLGFWLAYDEEK